MGWEEDLPKFCGNKSLLFAAYEAEVSRLLGPERVVRVAEDQLQLTTADGVASRIYLENLWVMCRNNPEEAHHHFSKFLSLAEDIDAPRTPIHRTRIVPQVRDQTFVEFFRDQALTKHFAGDLWIVYAEDRGETLSFLVQEDLQALGLSVEELSSMAMDNLYDALPAVNISYGEHFAELNTESGITSGGLLLTTLWDDLVAEDGRPLLAVLPCIGSILFCRGRENLLAMCEAAKELYEGADHPVSQTVLAWNSGRWSAFVA